MEFFSYFAGSPFGLSTGSGWAILLNASPSLWENSLSASRSVYRP